MIFDKSIVFPFWTAHRLPTVETPLPSPPPLLPTTTTTSQTRTPKEPLRHLTSSLLPLPTRSVPHSSSLWWCCERGLLCQAASARWYIWKRLACLVSDSSRDPLLARNCPDAASATNCLLEGSTASVRHRTTQTHHENVETFASKHEVLLVRGTHPMKGNEGIRISKR